MKEAHRRFVKYIFNTSVSLQDRAFVLYSVLVLIALYAAVPFGLLMHEPLSATVSTLIGAVVFSLYVYYVFAYKKIRQAKIVLSIIVVVIFLPAMFFTNGGARGGAPIWLLLGTVYIGLILEGRMRVAMLILNTVNLLACWIIGYKYPELVTEYSRGQDYFDSIAGLFIVGGIIYALILFCVSLSRRDEKNKNLHRLFDQTATALANAIDAKDEYTHGHSTRVAEYSRKIAEFSGKSPAECDEIYQIALLHDVGKIGIAGNIINKQGKLTNEEYEVIKQHPVLGAQILKSINEYPNLIIGAKYHHERYDGKGYPDRLKGDDIPEIARIISVADAYDAMTSKRSYRDPIPQQNVREEIVKGAGTQFDPQFANIMQHLIDLDTEYRMKERSSVTELAGNNEMHIGKFRSEISDGIAVTPFMTTIHLKYAPEKTSSGDSGPAMVLFDSLDGRYHEDEKMVRDLNYFEYCVIFFDGHCENKGVRKIRTETGKSTRARNGSFGANSTEYEITAVKVKDHALITIDDGEKIISLTIAFPDSARWAYIGLTGENCYLSDVDISRSETLVGNDYIPRIAEEITYIDGPEGDIPNIQVDGYRLDSTEGIPISDRMKITFHTMSLPTARLIWHCPYIDIFHSDDGKVTGENYHEYAFVRLDGENWEEEDRSENKLLVNKTDDFMGWEEWKRSHKEGIDCEVSFERTGDTIIVSTENLGVSVKDTVKIIDEEKQIYAALTGDQVAITNIRIMNPESVAENAN